jgi:hypothetical protein
MRPLKSREAIFQFTATSPIAAQGELPAKAGGFDDPYGTMFD